MAGDERQAATGDPHELSHCLSRRDDGELVPGARYGAGQRRSGGRRFGTRRTPRGAEEDEAMVSARQCLCRPTARRTQRTRLDRFDQRNATQLDRSFGRYGDGVCGERQRREVHDLHHPCRHDFWGNLHGARSRKRTRCATHHGRPPRRGGSLCGRHGQAHGTRTHRRPTGEWRVLG